MRKPLREQSSLHLPRNLQFVRGAALGFEFLRRRPALRLDRPADGIEAHELERVAVDVQEARERGAPDRIGLFERRLHARPLASALIANPAKPRRAAEANAARSPLVKLRGNVFRHEDDRDRAADFFVIGRFRARRDQGQDGAAVGRLDRDPALPRLEANIERELEPELVHEEADASLLVAHEDLDGLQAQVSQRGMHSGGVVQGSIFYAALQIGGRALRDESAFEWSVRQLRVWNAWTMRNPTTPARITAGQAARP
jgi:hypothetical protein